MRYDAFFLDFDGTIVDSALVKLESFIRLYSGERRKKRDISAYLLSEQGRPRNEKFRFIQESILGKSYTDCLGKELSERLDAEILKSGIPGLMPGILEFLQEVHNKAFVGIVSAAPRREIVNISDHYSILDFFDVVCGSEMPKSAAIRKCISDFDLSSDRCVMIGDSINDHKASLDACIDFIGFRYLKKDTSSSLSTIEDFHELIPGQH